MFAYKIINCCIIITLLPGCDGLFWKKIRNFHLLEINDHKDKDGNFSWVSHFGFD